MFDVLSEFIVEDYQISINFLSGEKEKTRIRDKETLPETLNSFRKSLSLMNPPGLQGWLPRTLGYCSYDAVQYFEDINLSGTEKTSTRFRTSIIQFTGILLLLTTLTTGFSWLKTFRR